jgi:hypothetical protein
MVRLDSAVDQRFTQTRRASDRKATSRHLPPGSGDVGLHEGAGPLHEVPEHLVLHPRGHRAAAEAGGRAAVRGGPQADREEGDGGLRRGDLRRLPMAVGPRRSTYGARPFDETTGG